MRHALLLTALLAFGLFAWRQGDAGQAGQPVNAGLPGARPVIEAARFPTLQAALDAIPPEGGLLRLPPGTFEVTEPLVLGVGDVLVEGSGTATNIVNKSAEGKATFIIRPKTYLTDPKQQLWRIQLSNLRLTGNEKSGSGIEATFVNEIFLHGVTVNYHGGHGVLLDRCYEDPRICNSLFTYNKQSGVELLGCHDIVVSGNQFEENLDALRCIDGYNLCMNGNNIDDHLRHGIVIENTYGSVVSGNMIEECKETGIILDRDCYGITVSANVIAHEFGCGIDLRDAHGCAVTGNSFPLVHNKAVVVGPESGRIAVSGNAFSDSYVGTAQTKRPKLDDPSGGLVLDGARHVNATGNVFSGLAVPAIQQPNPGEGNRIEGNVTVECPAK